MLKRRLSTAGLITAVIFYCFSWLPSLIPRDWPYQAIASGMSIVSGYAIGAGLGWLFRKVGINPTINPEKRRLWWRIGVVAGVLLAVAFMIFGTRTQNDLRALMGMDPVGPTYVTTVVVAVVLAAVILLVGRVFRWVAVALSRLLGRWIPISVAKLIGAAVVGFLIITLVNGVLVQGVIDGMNASASIADKGTVEGVFQPQASERSGSPSSPIPWESLGSQGRTFVAGGRSNAELAAFVAERGADVEVKTPIRVYAGLASVDGGTLDDVAALVVAELHRTNAWDRKVLVVTTTTGTGWVDPGMSESFELIHAGDTAIAAMQYSFLPSWVSFVADKITPPLAGKALFEAVYEAWLEQPEDRRPQLVAFGVSLGSFGGQGAFSGLQDMVARTQGAVWVGTPNFTEVWRGLTDSRDPGSFEWSPIYRGGEHARWGTDVNSAANMWDLGEDWAFPRVAYVQHGSDGVTWWAWDVLWKRPDWMREPRGPDVLPYLQWLPLGTFWQISMDMFVAGAVPPGHGHNYTLAYVDAFAAVAPPDGWTDADTARARQVVERILPTVP